MGMNQSSLAKSASTDNNEEIPKLEVKLSGERGLIVNQNQTRNIIEVSLEEFASSDSEEEDSDYCSSDDEQVDDEDIAERLRILDDAKKLKAYAVAFYHPEKPVEVDPTATARCYFGRPSAPEQESVEEAEYRRQVLEDAAALKKLAVDYAHPELGVVTSDPTATARCFFDRPSAPEQESVEEAEYRRQVLEDAAALKKLAVDYAHPELGVVTSDPTATARCYFDCPSAPEQESAEDAEYRRQVLEDAAALKKLAIDYAHPELGVVSSDPTATARCFFDRPSAPEQESLEDAEYRRQVLEDAAALKKLAIDYAHPELGVVTSDPTATARCYFDRPSAPQNEEKPKSSAPVDVLSPLAKKSTVVSKKKSPVINTSVKTVDLSKNKDIVHSLSRIVHSLSCPVFSNLASVKTVDSAISGDDIVRSLSSVQLFGLDIDSEADSSYDHPHQFTMSPFTGLSVS